MIIIPLEAAFLTFIVLAVGLAAAQESPDRSPAGGELVASAATSSGDSLRYGRHGSMRVQPGDRDSVVSILLEIADGLKSAGCLLYMVSHAQDDPDLIWVTEVWESRKMHRASLALEAVQEAIAQARPMLTGDFTAEEFEVVGGLGLP